jgi:hypothetical protein
LPPRAFRQAPITSRSDVAVGDAAVERIDLQAALAAGHDDGEELPALAVGQDDVSGLGAG